MNKAQRDYTCERCGKKITKEEHDTYSGICGECHEVEVDELDYEDEEEY